MDPHDTPGPSRADGPGSGTPGPSLTGPAGAVDASGTRGYRASADLPRTEVAPDSLPHGDAPQTTVAWTPGPGEGAPRGRAEPTTGPLGAEPTEPACRAATPPGVGRQFGDYTLVKKLGQGRQGAVWLALHQGLRRLVALKILSDSASDAHGGAERLRKEAERCAGLDTPGIVQVYEVGQVGDTVFFAMQLVDGFSLHEVIGQRRKWVRRESPVDLHMLAVKAEPEYLRAMAACLAGVSRSLHGAHAKGVIHRDVKPANILLHREHAERVYLADFGLAIDLNDLPTMGRTFEPGTPIYMPPEKLDPDPRRPIDEVRADVYSLGATAFEALTTRRLFTVPGGIPLSQLGRFLAKLDPPRPRTVAPRLPRDLDAILRTALDRNPALRYPSALALAQDLERFSKGEPTVCRPPGVVRRAWRTFRRHQRIGAALGAVLLIGATLGAARAASETRAAARVRRAVESADEKLRQGRLDDAVIAALGARSLAPDDATVLALTEAVTAAVLDRLRDEFGNPDVQRFHHWREVWLALRPRMGHELELFGHRHGLRPLPLVSDPPGAWVTLHGLRSDGTPQAGPPIYCGRAGSAESPGRFDDVIPGPYWVVARAAGSCAAAERTYLTLCDTDPSVPRSEFQAEAERELGRRLSRPFAPLCVRTLEPSPTPMGMVRIAAGRFVMGSRELVESPNRPGSRNIEYPAHEVDVAAFDLGVNEVTQDEFDAFLRDAPALPASIRVLWRAEVWGKAGRPGPGRGAFPVTGVTYSQAAEFAAWRGCRLPREDELEYAAIAGGARDVAAGAGPGPPALRAVGTDPADRVEHGGAAVFDLTGNAGEITLLKLRPYDPAYSANSQHFAIHWLSHAVRSGLFERPAGVGATSVDSLGLRRRGNLFPETINRLVGFRCARTPGPPACDDNTPAAAGSLR